MKLSIFLSGACFGAVAGIVAGYLVVADELRLQRQQTRQTTTAPQQAPTGGASGQQPTQQRTPWPVEVDVRLPPALVEKAERDLKAALDAAKPGDPPMAAVDGVLGPLRETTANDPKAYDAWVQLAHIYVKINRWPRAVEYLRGAHAARPADDAVLFALAQAHYKNNDPDGALDKLDELLARTPAHAWAHELKALALARSESYADARAAIAAAREALDGEKEADSLRRLNQLEVELPR